MQYLPFSEMNGWYVFVFTSFKYTIPVAIICTSENLSLKLEIHSYVLFLEESAITRLYPSSQGSREK